MDNEYDKNVQVKLDHPRKRKKYYNKWEENVSKRQRRSEVKSATRECSYKSRSFCKTALRIVEKKFRRNLVIWRSTLNKINCSECT